MKRILLFIVLAGSLMSSKIATSQNTPATDFKFGKGLNITAADSSIHLNLGFRFQSLFVSQGIIDDSDSWSSNAVIRRSRIKLNGWVYNPNIVYKVEIMLSNRDLKSTSDFVESGGAPKIILDAVLKWKVNKNLQLWVGQTKLPGNRERVVSSQKLQLVDRSLVNSLFNADRDIGIQLHSKFGNKMVVKPKFAISMGEGRNIVIDNIGGYDYTGRIEFLPFGEFTSKGDYFDVDLKREEDLKLNVGVAYNYNDGASRQKQSGNFLSDTLGNYLTNDLETFFVDVILKYKGYSLSGNYTNKSINTSDGMNPEVTEDEIVAGNGKTYITGDGYYAQLGYLFKNNWEVAGRYTSVTPDWDESFTGITEYTFGISKYIVGHNLKMQSDVTLSEKDGTDDQGLRYRLQFEIAF